MWCRNEMTSLPDDAIMSGMSYETSIVWEWWCVPKSSEILLSAGVWQSYLLGKTPFSSDWTWPSDSIHFYGIFLTVNNDAWIFNMMKPSVSWASAYLVCLQSFSCTAFSSSGFILLFYTVSWTFQLVGLIFWICFHSPFLLIKPCPPFKINIT